jgi:hypothetical protein
MAKICLPSLFPSMGEIVELISRFPNISIPSVSSPTFDDFSCPSIESMIKSVQLKFQSQGNIIIPIVQKIIQYGIGSLSYFFPKVPFLNMNLMELMLYGSSAISIIKYLITNTPDAISKITNFISLPVHSGFSNHSLSASAIYESVLNSCFSFTIDLVTKAIKTITDNLGITALTLLPMMTYQQILNLVDTVSGGIEGVYNMFSLPSSNVSPWYENITIPAVELVQKIQTLISDMNMYQYIKKIYDFVIDKLSSVLPLAITPICFDY